MIPILSTFQKFYISNIQLVVHYKLDYKVIIYEISNFYKSKLIECKI